MGAIDTRALTMGTALSNISFSLPVGSCTAVLGNNGSGKSTLLAILARIFSPTSGEAECLGPVSYLPEGFPIDEQLRVKQVIGLVAGTPGWESRWVSPLLSALDLPPRKRIRELSQGQRVQLGVALTLGRRVRTYLLDDPFLGLDPMARVRIERAIADRAAEATVLVASQEAAISERLCDHMLFLKNGELLWCAPFESWRSRFRRIRVRDRLEAIHELGELALVTRQSGAAIEVLLDDPAGMAESRLRRAGARVDPMALPLDELLMAVAA